MTNKKPITLEQVFRYYKQLPHQKAAIVALEEDIKTNGYAVAMRRDRLWFEIWSQSGKQRDYQDGIALIQQFEGFHHDAYLCPAGVWTIGWGNTTKADGTTVVPGDRISQDEGDLLLKKTVDHIITVLRLIPYWSNMNENQQSALISFAFNLGKYFYGQTGFETISRCLRERDYDHVPDAMLLYCNPGSSFEAGLRRRRIAEGELWAGHKRTPEPEPAKLTVNSPFSSRLTPHITLGEFALGQEARRFDHQYQLDTAAELAAFLERVRQRFGGLPLIITSGYRPPAINRSVGGASGSEHLYGAPNVGAVDFYAQGGDINLIQDWCDEIWPYSLGYGAKRGFIHLGIRQGRPRVRWDY